MSLRQQRQRRGSHARCGWKYVSGDLVAHKSYSPLRTTAVACLLLRVRAVAGNVALANELSRMHAMHFVATHRLGAVVATLALHTVLGQVAYAAAGVATTMLVDAQ